MRGASRTGTGASREGGCGGRRGAQPNGKSQIADCEIAESELQIPHPHPQELRLGSG